MNKEGFSMSMLKRYFLFICGLFFVALGISCIVKSTLGTAPISSAPYILSLRFPISLGVFTFVINMIFLLGQIVIWRRKFRLVQFWQIPMTGVFGCFIDFTMFLLSAVMPELYLGRFIMMLLGICSMALGIALEMIGNVVVLPGEGIVNAIASFWRLDFGNTKTCFDTSIVIFAALLSWIFFGEVRGVREGTLFSAFLTGFIARFLIKRLSYIDEQGNIVLRTTFAALSEKTEEK